MDWESYQLNDLRSMTMLLTTIWTGPMVCRARISIERVFMLSLSKHDTLFTASGGSIQVAGIVTNATSLFGRRKSSLLVILGTDFGMFCINSVDAFKCPKCSPAMEPVY